MIEEDVGIINPFQLIIWLVGSSEWKNKLGNCQIILVGFLYRSILILQQFMY